MRNLSKFLLPAVAAVAVSCGREQTTDEVFLLIENGDGPALGYSPASGTAIIKQDGYSFKDLNRNGVLDPYEDWRLDAGRRSADLASRMTAEEIAGLMLFSGHQAVPDPKSLYGEMLYEESGAEPWHITDRQIKWLEEEHLRHILLTKVAGTEVAARWNNEVQAYAEGLGHGIPCNNGSDPRHSAVKAGTLKTVYSEGTQGRISAWPEGLAMAATFDPEVARKYAEIASQEYRSLGITTALSPQADLGTEPRWSRIAETFGESATLARDMTKAMTEGFQTTSTASAGWGNNSVNAMVKHWPGGGTGEGGRDGHYAFGKFAVYPGGNFDGHLIPFTDGAFKLDGGTGMASAVMPSFTISWDQSPDSTNYGNAFSRYIITDLLREKYGYDGVVCTDWGTTRDEGATPDIFAGKPWGAEALSEAERIYMLLMAGVDQFGGNIGTGPILEAYRIGVGQYGEEFMRRRFEQSAVRLLRNIFRVGLFENPYIDPDRSAAIVGNPENMKAGYEAQLRSVVMLKNKDRVLPLNERQKVYVPMNYYPAVKGWGKKEPVPERWDHPLDHELASAYYELVEDPSGAELAIVFVNSPKSGGKYGGGFDIDDRTAGGNGYVPISLRYSPYLAEYAREESIAAGDPVIDPEITDRSYRWKNTTASNEKDLDIILETVEKMKGKPVVVVVNVANPMVFHEFEPYVDCIVARFGVSDQAVLDIISGRAEPSGLLPVQMPADMRTVEEQDEDRPFDMQCHVDTEGNTYDFAYGLNWNGPISDWRTAKYNK